MVIGNIGFCFADNRNQGGFPHIGKAHQPHIGQQFQFQLQFHLFPGQAGFGKPGRLPGGGGKMAVAPTAFAAAGNHMPFFIGQIGQNPAGSGFFHQGAIGHPDDAVFPFFPVAAATAPGFPVFGHIFPFIPEISQG